MNKAKKGDILKARSSNLFARHKGKLAKEKQEYAVPSPNNKKLSILYVLDILKSYSDEDHLLTQSQIAEKVFSRCGMECERKSIAASIDALIDYGYEIVKTKNGCYLADRPFEQSEINFLVDAVFSSQGIDGKQAKRLAEKITSLGSVYKRKDYSYLYKAETMTRTKNKQVFLSIDLISEAIKADKKISFCHVKGEQGTKPSVVSPYFLINKQGKYYLVCLYDGASELFNVRIDRIKNVVILDERRVPIRSVKGYENGIDVARYANENVYLLSSRSVKAKLRLLNPDSGQYIEEWFGDSARFYEEDGTMLVEISANERALIYWCLQYGEEAVLLSPEETKGKIICLLEQIRNEYKGE